MLRSFIILTLGLMCTLPLFSDEESESDIPSEADVKSKSDVHGYFDFVVKNDYITPRGLLVHDTGVAIQILMGLALDVYKDPDQSISDISVFLGIWNDIWTKQDNPNVGGWVECDWFAGFDVSFGKNWKLHSQFIEFLSPPGNFTPENNAEFTLSYDDSKGNLPIAFNPYVRLFWAISGDSTIVVGRHGNTYYVEFGMTPTITFNECMPIILSAPTWISVGPTSFWDGSKKALKHRESHFGVFSTGLKGTIELNFIPKSLGKWYFDTGFQYYYLINDNLLQAQVYTLNLSSIHSAKRNVCVGYAGFGFEF